MLRLRGGGPDQAEDRNSDEDFVKSNQLNCTLKKGKSKRRKRKINGAGGTSVKVFLFFPQSMVMKEPDSRILDG